MSLESLAKDRCCSSRERSGGAHFATAPSSLHVLVGQHQIMRTGFAGDIEPVARALRHERDAATATDMHDVQTAAGFRARARSRGESPPVPLHRARIEIIATPSCRLRDLSACWSTR